MKGVKHKSNDHHNGKKEIIIIGSSIIVIVLLAALKQVLQYRKTSELQKSLNALKIQWKGGESINDINDKDRDLCYLLSECFESEEVTPNAARYPDDPMNICHKYVVPYALKTFDSGFLHDSKDKLKGFISIDTEETDEYWRINMFNVCVRRDSRGKGVAKKMINEFIDEIIKKRKSSNNQVKMYAGLDIDFTTPDATSAFWLYTKLGFTSWWQGCPSTIIKFDYSKMTQEMLGMDAKTIEKRNEEALMAVRRDKIERFCMIKVIGEAGEVDINTDRIRNIMEHKLNV